MEARELKVPWDPKGIVFDLDGLILDSERFYCRAWQEAARELGYEITEEIYAQFVGIPNAEAERLLAGKWGPEFPVHEFSARWHRCWENLLQRERIPSKPGFEEWIALLRASAIPCAVATSSDRPDVLRALGERAASFSAIVSRDQVRHGKPAPDLFLEAACRLGLEPSTCLALEDSEAGLESAFAAGMPVILVPDMKPPSAAASQKAFLVASSLHEVRQWWELNRLHAEGDSEANGARLP